MKPKSLVFATVAAVAWAGAAWAHHSHSNYDTTAFTNLEGTVKELRWINPHVWVYLEVTATGRPLVWTIEGGSPSELVRGGWKRDDIKVGDRIKVRCHRLKDGANGCLFGLAMPVRGTEKELD